jgi:hypothetical protein
MSERGQPPAGVTNLEPHRSVGLPVLSPAPAWSSGGTPGREFHANDATFPDDASGTTGSPRSGDDPAGSDEEDMGAVGGAVRRGFGAAELPRDDNDDMLRQLMLGQPVGGLAGLESDGLQPVLETHNNVLMPAYTRIATLQEQVSMLHKRLKLKEDRANELTQRNRMLNKLEKGYTALMNDLRVRPAVCFEDVAV